MYHHRHSQQQGSQPFSNGPRPPHHQPPPSQHQNRPASGMMSSAMDFRFPRPTQLPDELESALAIRGARDMDHRLVDHMSRPNQHQNQSSGSGISQHGSYGSNPVTLSSDNQPGHQQGVDWSSFQPPTKLFASPSSSASHQPQRPQQQSQSSHTGTSVQNWTNPASDSPSSQARHPRGGGVDGQGLYTAESAGSILASFGLSNEDLEVLSHYPDDQLTPDTLPFILRDIQINKTGTQKTVSSSPASTSSFSRTIRDIPPPPSRSSPLARSRSPEVPSLLTVTQTAGKVIDYGHASRTKDESNPRETFKREQLSGERTVKMYPSSPSTAPKADKAERRQVRLEHTESSKHGDRDYRRTSSDHRKSNRSPGREFPPSSKSCNLDRDYRHDGPKPRPSPDTRSETSSRRSLSSSSGSKPHSSSKKLPTPTMISDFSAAVPKVYPHTCSLCDIQCDQEKDWVDHINTVNHTAACRDLRNKYPGWKPNLPSRSGRYGSRALWDPKDHSHSVSRSFSGSPSPSPPHSRHRVGPPPHRPHGRPYSRYQHYTGGSSRSAMKRPNEESRKFSSETSRHPSFPKAGHSSKHGPLQSYTKTVRTMMKPGTKTNKTASGKAADTSAKPPPAKKKKKVSTAASQHSSFADRLVYLTGIPKDASEQEVTDLVGSFGKINNVILMPCSEEESQKGEGQKASVCMVRVEDAQALSKTTELTIRDQQITASVAKKPEAAKSSEANNSKSAPGQDKGTVGEDAGGETDPKTSDEKGIVLISGLPESGWSESDIIKLLQPFGVTSDIILATQIGKVLVFVSDMEIAQEIVKVNTFIPMKIGECELKMIHLKQCVSLATPVALYNLLMGSVEPLETSVPVGWSSLLVIRNVPSTPSGSTEVQKLVRRFGTVIKTLVLNSMVICEMPTAAMALSVYKRFQAFPCIIQNNPLFFSRKPDPKTSTLTKVNTAYLGSSEDGKTAAAADKEDVAPKEGSDSPGEGMEKDEDGKDEEVKGTEKTVPEHEALGENRSIDDGDKKEVLTDVESDCLGAVDAQPEASLVETDMRETAAAANVMETTEEEKDGSKEEGDKTPADEETLSQAASVEKAIPELPKVTQAMVNALLVECRTRTSKSNNTAASSNGEQAETPLEAEQGEKPAEETTEPAENHMEQEELKNQEREELKNQERERKEREARKEKEAKERRERERRAWEKERAKRERERDERARREREKREEERREWERRERARRERKRAYEEGSRSSHRMEGYRQSSWRDGKNDSSDAKRMEVEEESDEFPFNLSDFVTVDEVGDVGDVADLPPSPSPTVPIETAEESTPTSVQKDTEADTSMEVTTETVVSDTDKPVSESGVVTTSTAEPSNGSVLTPASQSDPSQAHVSTCQPEAPETETGATATEDSATVDETLPEAAPGAGDCSSHSPAPQAAAAQGQEDESGHSQAKEEETVSGNTEEQQKTPDGEETLHPPGAPTVETGKNEESAAQANPEEEKRVEKKLNTSGSLPPFNPSHAVGMEFLVPKTGFFCKVCNRFFSGGKEAEISHCKTLKHYENLQKYLQTKKTESAKPACS